MNKIKKILKSIKEKIINKGNIAIIISILSILFNFYQYFNNRKENIMPYLEASLIKNNYFDLVIENIGNGVAKDIQIIYRINDKNFELENNNKYFVTVKDFDENNNEEYNKVYIKKEMFTFKAEKIFSVGKEKQKNIKADPFITSVLNLLLDNRFRLKDEGNLMDIDIIYHDLLNRKYKVTYRYKAEIFINSKELEEKLLILKLFQKK